MGALTFSRLGAMYVGCRVLGDGDGVVGLERWLYIPLGPGTGGRIGMLVSAKLRVLSARGIWMGHMYTWKSMGEKSKEWMRIGLDCPKNKRPGRLVGAVRKMGEEDNEGSGGCSDRRGCVSTLGERESRGDRKNLTVKEPRSLDKKQNKRWQVALIVVSSSFPTMKMAIQMSESLSESLVSFLSVSEPLLVPPPRTESEGGVSHRNSRSQVEIERNVFIK